MSVPSFLTGSLYNFDEKLSEWKNNYRTNGIIGELINNQYEIWQCIQSNSMKHKNVKKVTTNLDLLVDKSKLSLIIELSDFVLLRISHNFCTQKFITMEVD